MTTIGCLAFDGCNSLTQINMPESLTYLGSSVFRGCKDLTHMTIPKKITHIYLGLFNTCINLTQISIPKGVTAIDFDAFLNCSSLTKVNIPESVTEIGNAAFANCTRLSQINIPKSLKKIAKYAFRKYSNDQTVNWIELQHIVVDNDNEIERIKTLLPRSLHNKVTSFYLKHQENLNIIRQRQFSIRFNFFECIRAQHQPSHTYSNIFTYNIYQFLSPQDTIAACSALEPIENFKNIALGIWFLQYNGIVPTTTPRHTCKLSTVSEKSDIEQNDSLSEYTQSLNQYNSDIKQEINKQLKTTRHLQPKSDNMNRDQNNGGVLCSIS